MLPKAGEVHAVNTQTPKEAARYRLKARKNPIAFSPDMEGWKLFAQEAEKAGIEGVLISFSAYEPDPVTVACALGGVTSHLKYIIAFRSGLVQPPAFVQQINTLSGLIGGRLILNTVAGSSITEQQSYGDFLAHDDRYDRATEFLSVCNALWKNQAEVDFDGEHYKIAKGRVLPPFESPHRTSPEIFVSGHSDSARKLAVEQGTCWLRVIDTPEKIEPMVQEIRSSGIEVCLRLGIICRDTREEALKVINEILELTGDDGKKIAVQERKDSQMFREAKGSDHNIWYNENIWAGFTPHYGPVWTALVGTPDEIVNIFMEYKKIGISQFIISGFPEIDEVKIFGEKILPALRQAEKALR
jgi:alkanesulfonate monooxygenase